ncbi:HDL254Cp [Eremothecium sinecaudum]|uniref:HDL254Cp n=1 Tax=Eremothecium sinecaudum TaxID=45286 RepID=A0A109UYX3_9SACH|nr:HDL254Cp [Eremothecium sinecaudum]AMD20490.1 HDL254Cp [Eremothecium sinecaudum]
MVDLINVYAHIEAGEQYSRDSNYLGTVKEYNKALEKILQLEDSVEVNEGLKDAIGLLKQDLLVKIKELQHLQQKRPNNAANSATVTAVMNSGTVRVQGSVNEGGNSISISDPFLASIVNKLHMNILQSLSQLSGIQVDKTELEQLLMYQIKNLEKEIALFEQRKFREYDSKMEQLIKENKRLSNQVLRLKDRWDSLVESARQKRNQQDDNAGH